MARNKEAVKIVVKVQPNAHKNEVLGFQDDVLRVKIAAPPVDGKANKALIAFLSEVLGISKSNVDIDKGETSKTKVVLVNGISKALVMERAAARSSAGTPKLL